LLLLFCDEKVLEVFDWLIARFGCLPPPYLVRSSQLAVSQNGLASLAGNAMPIAMRSGS